MTVALKLKPEVEAGLLAQAEASGMTLEEYLLSLVESAALAETQRISSAEDARLRFRPGPARIVPRHRSLITP